MNDAEGHDPADPADPVEPPEDRVGTDAPTISSPEAADPLVDPAPGSHVAATAVPADDSPSANGSAPERMAVPSPLPARDPRSKVKRLLPFAGAVAVVVLVLRRRRR